MYENNKSLKSAYILASSLVISSLISGCELPQENLEQKINKKEHISPLKKQKFNEVMYTYTPNSIDTRPISTYRTENNK